MILCDVIYIIFIIIIIAAINIIIDALNTIFSRKYLVLYTTQNQFCLSISYNDYPFFIFSRSTYVYWMFTICNSILE